jgi:hypothetical protein
MAILKLNFKLMVRGIDFERFLGPPKYFALLFGPQA